MKKQSYQQRFFLISMTVSLMLGSLSSTAHEKTKRQISAPLTDNGEIILCTFADKIVLPNGKKDLEQTLKNDLMQNEASLAPIGGDKFSCANRDYKWGIVKLIDGKAPSEFPSVYAATRPSKDIINSRPAIKRVSLGENVIAEEWTFRITEVSQDCQKFSYEVIGSVTGNDGKGTNKSKFVSKSGRISLEPRDLAPFYNKRNKTDEMVGFEIKWNVVAMCVDRWKPQPTQNPEIENLTTLVQGLPNTKHTLELILNGDGQIPIKSIKVYTPSLK